MLLRMKPTHSKLIGWNHKLRPSAWWAEHFKRDLQRDWTIPWYAAVSLTPAEWQRISKSIAEFQRGESSDARNYLHKSARFARESDPAFHLTSQLFVASENLHAELLLRFMQFTGIPVHRSSSRDGVFRWLRRCSDLGWATRVIIIAELVAQEYYPCLRAATVNPALTRICDRVIAEEAAHIRFQIERIVRVETSRHPLLIKIRDVAQRALMWGTACVVYAGHRPVLNTRSGFWGFLARVEARNRRIISALVAFRQVIASRALTTPNHNSAYAPYAARPEG
jgi:hypothetical protein